MERDLRPRAKSQRRKDIEKLGTKISLLLTAYNDSQLIDPCKKTFHIGVNVSVSKILRVYDVIGMGITLM